MAEYVLPPEAQRAVEFLRQEGTRVDIVVGIPSYNNARTIGHVVRAVQAGLMKYFPQFNSVIINSDGGSKDGTREAVLAARLESPQSLLLLDTPLLPVHRLSFPYHGVPGKGSAFRMIFKVAVELGAQACAVVDADLRSITPEWVDLLLRPVLQAAYDFVAPYYKRHKYDGTITNSIAYPLIRALYGYRVRQPIGGEFGISDRLLRRYLERDDWETDVARYGIDIWMTTIALAEGYRVCQSFLGSKIHDPKDPSADLTAMLVQVIGSMFTLMQEYERIWKLVRGSKDLELFGFRYEVGVEPVNVNVQRMIEAFVRGCSELEEVWELALQPETLKQVLEIGKQAQSAGTEEFRFDDELWTRIIYEFSAAHKHRPVERGIILKSLTPLYLARVASFVLKTWTMGADEVEREIEQLCLKFEEMKDYLIAVWEGKPPGPPAATAAEKATTDQPLQAGKEIRQEV